MTGPEKELAYLENMMTYFQARSDVLRISLLDRLPEEGTPPHKPLCHDNPDKCEEDFWFFDLLSPVIACVSDLGLC